MTERGQEGWNGENTVRFIFPEEDAEFTSDCGRKAGEVEIYSGGSLRPLQIPFVTSDTQSPAVAIPRRAYRIGKGTTSMKVMHSPQTHGDPRRLLQPGALVCPGSGPSVGSPARPVRPSRRPRLPTRRWLSETRRPNKHKLSTSPPNRTRRQRHQTPYLYTSPSSRDGTLPGVSQSKSIIP